MIDGGIVRVFIRYW